MTDVTALLAEWDAAATPNAAGNHNGAGWARDNWESIRAALGQARAELDLCSHMTSARAEEKK